jgi:tetratricopeptide (TPR) repeat protein
LDLHKRYEPAAQAFRDHWVRFEKTLKEPLREESLRNLVHSLEQIEDQKKENGKALSPVAVEILKYTAEYGAKYSTTKYARAIAFLRTVMQFKYTQVEDGIAESQKVFDADIKDDFGKRAFKNLKVAYYEKKDWQRTFNWSSEMMSRPIIAASPYAPELKTVREESLFLWADTTQDNLASAALFLKIAHEPAMERLRDKAFYNAFVRFQKAEKRVEALQTGIELQRVSPQFKELSALASVRAAIYEEAGDYANALPLFIQFLNQPPADAEPSAIQQARLHAGMISEAMQKYSDANTLYRLVLANEQKDQGAIGEAKRGLDRLETKGKRAPAAQFKKWDMLQKVRADLEKEPLAKSADLAAQIQGGAAKLEKGIKLFLEVSGDALTPPQYAFEAYCTVPFLYGYWQAGVRGLGAGQADDLKAELEKLASPLDAKASELAMECLSRSEQAFHDGPMFRKVLEKWGWAMETWRKERVDKVVSALAGKAPWIDASTVPGDDAALVLQHLQTSVTPDSWYALAKQRFDANQLGLARLTLRAGLSKEPNSPRILNALAVIEQMSGTDPVTLSVLYEKALGAGSGLAGANLALLHLNGGRLEKGTEALKQADAAKVFSGDTATAVAEMLAPPPTPIATALPVTADNSAPQAGATPATPASAAAPATNVASAAPAAASTPAAPSAPAENRAPAAATPAPVTPPAATTPAPEAKPSAEAKPEEKK